MFYRLYPDEGPLRRELYPKHLEFFTAGVLHNERAFIAGNRTGKSLCVCYEATCHLTGIYPDWWPGRRFTRPTIGWAAGEDAKALRESLEPTLFGSADRRGTGVLPRDLIVRIRPRGNVADAIDFALVRHVSGGLSRLVVKTYDQRRPGFQGAKIDFGILDEEPPMDIYGETLTRTMATDPNEENGSLMCAFTPLKGVSETVLLYLPGGTYPDTEEVRREAWGW